MDRGIIISKMETGSIFFNFCLIFLEDLMDSGSLERSQDKERLFFKTVRFFKENGNKISQMDWVK